MTRARQTISIALLVSSVRRTNFFFGAYLGREIQESWLITIAPQLYLSLYLELIPLPLAVQKDVVPAVRSPLIPKKTHPGSG